MSRLAPLVLAALVLASVFPATPAAASPSSQPLRVDVDRTIPGADTFLFSVRIQAAGGPDHFNIANDSRFTVEGFFGPNGSSPQDAASARGAIQYLTGLDCPPRETNNVDPCFLDATPDSIKDAWDASARAGPVEAGFDPDWWTRDSYRDGIHWDGWRRYEIPLGADQLTMRFFVTVPGAEAIHVRTHLHSPQAIELHRTVAHDGGFLATGEDFEPTAGADTAPASAMAGGQHTVNHGEEGRLYAAFGPSFSGVTSAGPVAARHNTAAWSDLAYESPDGERTEQAAFAFGDWSGIPVAGANETGEHRFEVEDHVGVGPQDVYLVGFQGPTG